MWVVFFEKCSKFFCDDVVIFCYFYGVVIGKFLVRVEYLWSYSYGFDYE